MHYELVKVINRALLLNPVQIECLYQTPEGRPLARGIYAVVWPIGVERRKYDANAEYHGPFPSWRQAGDFVRSSLGVRNAVSRPSSGWSQHASADQ